MFERILGQQRLNPRTKPLRFSRRSWLGNSHLPLKTQRWTPCWSKSCMTGSEVERFLGSMLQRHQLRWLFGCLGSRFLQRQHNVERSQRGTYMTYSWGRPASISSLGSSHHEDNSQAWHWLSVSVILPSRVQGSRCKWTPWNLAGSASWKQVERAGKATRQSRHERGQTKDKCHPSLAANSLEIARKTSLQLPLISISTQYSQ